MLRRIEPIIGSYWIRNSKRSYGRKDDTEARIFSCFWIILTTRVEVERFWTACMYLLEKISPLHDYALGLFGPAKNSVLKANGTFTWTRYQTQLIYDCNTAKNKVQDITKEVNTFSETLNWYLSWDFFLYVTPSDYFIFRIMAQSLTDKHRPYYLLSMHFSFEVGFLEFIFVILSQDVPKIFQLPFLSVFISSFHSFQYCFVGSSIPPRYSKDPFVHHMSKYSRFFAGCFS